jgi:hypothetical protein
MVPLHQRWPLHMPRCLPSRLLRKKNANAAIMATPALAHPTSTPSFALVLSPELEELALVAEEAAEAVAAAAPVIDPVL